MMGIAFANIQTQEIDWKVRLKDEERGRLLDYLL